MRELRRRIPVLDRKRGLPFGSRPRGRLMGWTGVVPISLRERIIGILPFSERLYHRFVHSHGAAELPFVGWRSSRPRKLRSACRVPLFGAAAQYLCAEPCSFAYRDRASRDDQAPCHEGGRYEPT